MEQLLSIERTAEVLAISPWTVRAWIQQGKLGSAKLGSRRLVPQSEIDKLINDSRVDAIVPGLASNAGSQEK
jgi:excisionase family DNA binding protein